MAMAVTGRERCLRAIRGQPVDRVPAFPLLMFLAADRLGVRYREYATSGTTLAEAQLAVAERFGLDAITACSDAFRVSADLGGEMGYPEDHPPHLLRPLVTGAADVERLVRRGRPDPSRPGSRMDDRVGAVAGMVRAAGDRTLVLGWVDMPFAEAASACGVQDFLLLMLDEPLVAHRLLDWLTGVVIEFALAQLAAGAPMIGAGDAAASLVSPAAYREFALPYERRVCDAIHAAGGLVKLHVCGDTTGVLEDMATSGADLCNVDAKVDLARAAAVYGSRGVALKGNLDPVALIGASPEAVAARAAACLATGSGARYLLGAGCEVPAAVSDEAFRALCEAPSRAARPATGVPA
jgi:MtaA/CmuA family methyltransferase